MKSKKSSEMVGTPFTSCFPIHHYGGVWPQYYQVGTSNTGKLREIKKICSSYIKPKNCTDSGYLTFRFLVNCHGKIGEIEILECTEQFEPLIFSKEIKDQLLSFLIHRIEWIPGCDQNGVPVDSQKFLTFIFSNGELIDIVPK